MLKLTKYLKPFIFSLIMAVILLFVQAMTDLNLPNYMSDIVNIGISQNGIEHAAPEVISAEGYAFIKTFMNKEEQSLLDKSYTLADSFSADPANKLYKKLSTEKKKNTYVKTGENSEALDDAFGTATWTLINAVQDMSASSQSSEADAEQEQSLDQINLADLYPMQAIFASPQGQPLIHSGRTKAEGLDPMIRRQSGVMLTKLFYKELGLSLDSLQQSYILRIGLMMLLVAFIGGAATVCVSFLSSRLAAGVAKNLRRDIFSKVSSFTNGEFDQFSTASLITRSTNDVTQIQMFLTMGIRMLCYAPIMGIGGVLMAVRKSPSMSWILALACLILLCLIAVVFIVAMPKFKLTQKLIDRLNLVSRETLGGLMEIRAFGTRNHEKKRFETANSDLTKTNLFINRVMVFMMPFMMLVMNGVTLLIVWVGAHQIADANMQIGDMVAYMQYAMQVIMSFLMIAMMFIFIPRASVSADRIAEVLNTEALVTDPKSPREFDPARKGVIEFKNVGFRYHGAQENSIDDISFTAMPGQTTAFIGSTGSGKSTIVNLMLRFYDATEGAVLVDGVDVREVTQEALRSKIGYVPQKGILLSGTIGSNLKYGNPEASDEVMETGARVAQAMEFISEKEDGFESDIAQGGGNVSGGQKQRLSIARALVKQPEIFIFDDSFSALDFKTDASLRKALKEHTGDSTVILVAQRVNTIMGAEQIIVLDEGKIVGKGTHRELLESCPAYYEIASSQLSKEELQ